MWEDILVNLAISSLLVAIKNPDKQKTMRRVFLKVFSSIWFVYQGDADFRAVVGAEPL